MSEKGCCDSVGECFFRLLHVKIIGDKKQESGNAE